MKTKKSLSMATVLSRTCPCCFTMVDPLWYGWHISKCSSNKQDMAPSTTLIKHEADSSQLAVDTCEEGFVSLPEACTLSLPPDSQFIVENSSEDNIKKSLEVSEVSEQEILLLRAEKQALADRVKDVEIKLEQLECQLRAEKQASAGKVKDLELNVEELECQLRLSKESERKALCLVESLHVGSKEESGHTNEAGQCSQFLEASTREMETSGLGKQSVEFGSDEFNSCDKQRKEVLDQDKWPDHLKEQVVETILTTIVDNSKLDRLVDLAYTGEIISDDYFSHVNGLIKDHKALSSAENTSRMQEIPVESIVNANNGDRYQDIPAKSDNQDGTMQHIDVLANPLNGSPATVVPNEEHRAATRVAQETPSNFSNDGSLINYQAAGHGGAKLNGDSVVKTNDCRPSLDAHGATIDKQLHTSDEDKSTGIPQVLCEEESHAKQAHPHSSSSSFEFDVHVVKSKPGLRRIVLSDSESEGGNIQAACGNHQDILTNLSSSKEPDLPHTSTRLTEESIHTENGVENGVSQPPLPWAVQSSDQFDNDACNQVNEPSSPRSAQGLKISATNIEGAGVDGVKDGEHTGVRRSKRLRTLSSLKSQNEVLGIPSSKKKIQRRTVVSSSSSAETSRSMAGSKSEATANTNDQAVEITLDVQGIPSSRRVVRRRRVEVSISSSAETSGGSKQSTFEASADTDSKVIEIPRGRSRNTSRVQKRLFEEVESKPAFGNNHSTDSEDNDNEIESDADSLKDFIADSESVEDSRSSSDDQSLSRSHSSKEAYCNPRLGRDLKIRSYVWELEAEMLSAFAVNPELCLRAVCAINRRQTEDEQQEKASKYVNKRGFDKLYAGRGTRMAGFLTDGDPLGPVKKSIEDLKKFDDDGLELCKMLAAKHSKQLFDIYSSGEDPHFPFS